MKLQATTTTALLAALPALSGLAQAAVKVGYGQQIQRSDETNHWVVWIEGESACPNTRTLGRLVDSPCGTNFNFNGDTYHLADCDGNHEPHTLVGAGTTKKCTFDHRKIHCHNGLHDIVKHGKCT